MKLTQSLALFLPNVAVSNISSFVVADSDSGSSGSDSDADSIQSPFVASKEGAAGS